MNLDFGGKTIWPDYLGLDWALYVISLSVNTHRKVCKVQKKSCL